LGWIPKLPWGNAALSTQLIAMLVFVLGGITGLINASFNVNQVIHNTAWVPGHFHMTVGTASALSFMGIAYWLVPWLLEKELWGRKLAVAQGWMWGIGVLVMGRGLASGGLEGMPRRTDILDAPYGLPSWDLAGTLAGIGGAFMFVAGIMFFVVLLGTMFLAPEKKGQTVPVTEVMHAPATTGWPLRLDNIRLWVVVTIILIVIAYAPFFIQYFPLEFNSPGFVLF
jgi:cytochrome c oxidase subunit 1